MLKQRIITALILAPIMIGGIFFLPLQEFMYFIGFIVAVGAWEWANLSGVSNQMGRLGYVALVVAGMFGFAQLDTHQAQWLLWLALAWWLFAFVLVRSYPKGKTLWGSTASRLVIGLVILLPMWVGFVEIKTYPQSGQLIMYVMLLVWGADVGAYFAGRQFGKHKLAKNVSPGKTWEGVYGGLATTAVVAVLSAFYLQNQYAFFSMDIEKWVMLFAITALVVVVSVLGDLIESMVKRHRGIKDSSNLLPGHGGVMDRIDSMTAAVPVFALALSQLDWKILL